MMPLPSPEEQTLNEQLTSLPGKQSIEQLLNTQLDTLTAIAADNKDRSDRRVKFQIAKTLHHQQLLFLARQQEKAEFLVSMKLLVLWKMGHSLQMFNRLQMLLRI